ncbi:hypothetical protein ACWXWU_03985 [Shewanella sp. A14]
MILNEIVKTIAANKSGISLMKLSKETGIEVGDLKPILNKSEFFTKIPNTNKFVINRFSKTYENDESVAEMIMLEYSSKRKRFYNSVLIILISIFIVLIST